MRKPIGTYCMSNVGGLAVYDIDYSEDAVLVGTMVIDSNPGEPEWCKIVTRENEDGEDQDGFLWGELFIPFSEVMRVT